MIPKTKLQKEVVALSAKLPKINQVQTKYAFENCLDRFAAVVRKTIFCLECGHDWKNNDIVEDYYIVHAKPNQDWKEEVLAMDKKAKGPIHIDCPKCKKDLTLTPRYDNGLKEAAYYSIITVKNNFQVVRFFYVDQWMKKKVPGRKDITEVLQFWILPNGKTTVMAIKGAAMGGGYYGDQWSWGSELTVKPSDAHNYHKYNINPFKIFPKIELIPELIRNGFSEKIDFVTPQFLMKKLLTEPMVETFIKLKQEKLLKQYFNYPAKFSKYWASIKICIRNKYIIEDPSIWFDYLELLTYFKRDLHNNKNICPVDLKKAHNGLLKKKKNIERKQKLAELRERMIKDQVLYLQQKKKFFNLRFVTDDIEIVPMKSVKQFMEEGDFLEHCIFENQYYNKKDDLLFSARVKGIVTETIDFSLTQMVVKQARGFDNNATLYHDSILALFNQNIKLIKECLKPKKKNVEKSEKEAA